MPHELKLPEISLSADPAALQVWANLTRMGVILLENAPPEALERVWQEYVEVLDFFDKVQGGIGKGFARLRDKLEAKKG
jgi:hypothetical protein